MLKILDMKNGLVTRVSIFNAPIRLKEPMKFEDVNKRYSQLCEILLKEDIDQHFFFCKSPMSNKKMSNKKILHDSDNVDSKGEVVLVYQSNNLYSAPLKNLKLEFMNSKILKFQDIYNIINKYLDKTYTSIVYKYISYLESTAFIYRVGKGTYQYNDENQIVNKDKVDIEELRKIAIEEAKAKREV